MLTGEWGGNHCYVPIIDAFNFLLVTEDSLCVQCPSLHWTRMDHTKNWTADQSLLQLHILCKSAVLSTDNSKLHFCCHDSHIWLLELLFM